MKVKEMRSQTDQSSSGATVQRLTQQLQNSKGDLQVLHRQREELEKVIKEQKDEILEADRKHPPVRESGNSWGCGYKARRRSFADRSLPPVQPSTGNMQNVRS